MGGDAQGERDARESQRQVLVGDPDELPLLVDENVLKEAIQAMIKAAKGRRRPLRTVQVGRPTEKPGSLPPVM